MNDLRSLLDAASRRLAAARFLRGLHLGLVGAGLLCFLLVLLAKSSSAVILPWTGILIALGIAVLACGVVAVRAGRPSQLSVATLVDEKLGLKERLSTALAVHERSDPFAMAAVADAVASARDKRVRESLSRGVPVKAPSSAWIGPALLLTAGVIFLLAPQTDLFRSNAVQDELLEAARTEAAVAVREVERRIEENPLLSEALGLKHENLDHEQLAPEAMERTPEEVRRDAIKRMTDLERKLNDVLRGEQAAKLNALRDQLSHLETKDDATKDLAEALKAGDFAEAAESLEQLSEQAAGMSDEERAALEQQLKDLADRLEEAAARRDALKEALEKAGLDGKLASNPEAMKQAMEQAKQLTAAQREALRKAMQSQQSAQQQMRSMCQGMKQCAESMCQGGQCSKPGGQAGQAGQQAQSGQPGGQEGGEEGLAGMLSDMDALARMMAAAQAAAAEAASQSQNTGQGMSRMAGSQGGEGASTEGRRDQEGSSRIAAEIPPLPMPAMPRTQRHRTQTSESRIVMRQLVEGHSFVGGEATTGEVERVTSEITRTMEQGIADEQVPAHLRGVHRHYFGEVKRRFDARKGAESQESSSSSSSSDEGAAEKKSD